MDIQSRQPMLGGNVGQPLQIEAGNIGRVHSTHSFFKKNRSKGLICGLITASILCVILFIALCVTIFSREELCLTSQCLRTASSFYQSADFSVDPCDNFYKFVCGRWGEEHIVRNGKRKNSWFEERNDLLDKAISDFLTEDEYEDDATAIQKAKIMYKSCLNTDAMDEVGFKKLVEILKQVGLPSKPLISKRTSWDWISNVAKARKILDMQILLGFSLTNSPTNRTINKLSIDVPKDLELNNLKLKNKDKLIVKREEEKEDEGDDENDDIEEKVNAWKEETGKFLRYFYEVDNTEITETIDAGITKAAENIVNFRSLLDELEKEDDVVKAKSDVLGEEMTVYELQKFVNQAAPRPISKIKWLHFFDVLYNNTSVTDVKSELMRNETILVFNKPYYSRLSEFLNDLSDYQIGLFVWWKIVYELSLHVNTELTELRKQVDLVPGFEYGSREEVCLATISTVMRPAIAAVVLEQPNLSEKYLKVEEMILNIKEAFKSLVRKLSWMDEITKARTIEKVTVMEAVILYPDWMDDYSNFNVLYENITVSEDTHLSNLLQIFEEDGKSILVLHEYDNSTGTGLDPLDVNAFYTQQENLVFVPAMILQYPFYDLGLEALNYGSIGVIIGHEVTHGFDDTGRYYDKEGNYHEWWTDKDNSEYSKRAQCYVDKFGSYYIESVNKTIDGNRTLDENLADNGGIIEGFLAYKKYVDMYGEEPKLPGFENYTHEQLYFMSFAHTWCTNYDSDDGILEDLDDEHSPEFVRTVMTLQDSEEFSKAWNCPKGSNMNPREEKCALWVD